MAFFARAFFTCRTTHGHSGGGAGGQPVPLTGRATHPTATWLFLPALFSPAELPTGIPGVVRGTASPPDRLQQRRNRYMAFFAKLFSPAELPTGIPGVVRGTASPPDRLQQRRNRYMAFFAKLFFTWKKSGSCVGVLLSGDRGSRSAGG